MPTWISLFADFTSEALLFEAFAIFALICVYLIFWILRKRRFGVVEDQLPSGPVKVYLNELIQSAELLRAQLFGLLAKNGELPAGFQFPQMTIPTAHAVGGNLSDLEAQLAKQKQAVESLTKDKYGLEEELKAARDALNNAGSGQDAQASAEVQSLQSTVKDLEARLAEYSVIEDDLANLKRFQQENSKLKSLLEQKGIPVPGSASAESSGGATPTASEPEADPEEPTSPDQAEEEIEEAEAASEDESPSEKPAAAPKKGSTAQKAKAQEASADEPEESESGGDTPNPGDKSEEDLVAEFEKMLKS